MSKYKSEINILCKARLLITTDFHAALFVIKLYMSLNKNDTKLFKNNYSPVAVFYRTSANATKILSHIYY